MGTKITIPKPCHEDWNKMTPTQKGAFCKVCTKEVKDFSKSTDYEIIQTLNKAQDKVCGRFTTDQLNRPMQTQVNWRKVALPFAAGILGFVFNGNGQIMMGEVGYQEQPPVQDSILLEKGDVELSEAKKREAEKRQTKGEVAVRPIVMGKVIAPVERQKRIEAQKAAEEAARKQAQKDSLEKSHQLEIMGDTVIQPTPQVDSVRKIEVPKVEKSICSSIMLGMIAPIETIDTMVPPKDTTPQFVDPQTDTLWYKEKAKPFNESKISAYPNPTTGPVTVNFGEEGTYNLAVYNQSGKVVYKRMVSGQSFELSLEDQPSGMYFIQVTTSAGEEKKLLKIIKR